MNPLLSDNFWLVFSTGVFCGALIGAGIVGLLMSFHNRNDR